MLTTLPSITVIIPTLNEEHFIANCVNSLVSGNYPSQSMEMLVVDGGSSDKTREKVLAIQAQPAVLRLLDNPRKIVPAAINIGIAEASHDIVIWVGAHAIYDPDYLTNSVKVLLEENCASVGGVITPIGKTCIGKAIAVATRSKFGTGNAKYRYADRRQAVDTVFGGCWRKADILRIGGFNEKWVRNQDYELNCRLRAKVGDIILDPSIRCNYYCRDSIAALAKQYFNYGFWRFFTFLKHPASFTFRQAAPLILFAGLLACTAIAFINPVAASLLPLFYGLSCVGVGAYLGFQQKQANYLILLPVIFVTLHISWATGFLKGALQALIRKAPDSIPNRA